ncbi:MAG: ferrous iron transport protein A [Clostridia bacterium]|nr:ferrous iron transport protein A [Clostridia bacterium]
MLKTSFLPLSKSKPNKSYKIISINCKGQIKRRLLDLGIIPGTFIKNIQCSPLGDPTAFLVRGAIIAIRKEDTKKIVVESV